MTDMKISDGAVERMARLLCLLMGDDPSQKDALGAENWLQCRTAARGLTAAALTYYATHPDELPQEVVDAVLRDVNENDPQWLALLKYRGIVKTEGF